MRNLQAIALSLVGPWADAAIKLYWRMIGKVGRLPVYLSTSVAAWSMWHVRPEAHWLGETLGFASTSPRFGRRSL